MTPEAPDLHRLLVGWLADGADSVVMEVSSQGLDQRRVEGLSFDVGVWLNLGHDHLDYHGTIEQYYATKAMLFEGARCRQALICVDDEWGRRLASQVAVPMTTFGRDASADVHVEVASTGLRGTQVWLPDVDGGVRLRAPVVGEVNAANMTAAYLAARALGTEPSAAAPGARGSVTRARPVRAGLRRPAVPRDRRLRPHTGRAGPVDCDRSGPDRARGCGASGRGLPRRPGPLQAAADRSGGGDRGPDSPAEEDPSMILRQVLAGTLDVPRAHIRVEPDRRAAIGLAVPQAKPAMSC